MLMNDKFDDNFVSVQLNAIGAAPLLNLMRKGCGARLSIDTVLSKLQPYIKNSALENKFIFIRDVLNIAGCNETAYILKGNQIIFRPRTEISVNYLLNLNEQNAKKLAKEASDKFIVRQRHIFRICVVFLGKSKCNTCFCS